MGSGTYIRDGAKAFIASEGTTITIYLSPTRTLDDEGKSAITKGTGTSTKALFFSDTGDTIGEIYGNENYQTFRVHIPYDVGTVTNQSILLIDSEYYKTTMLNKHAMDDIAVVYYELSVEKIQDQTTVS